MTSIDVQLEGDGCWPDLVELHEAGKVHWHGQLVGAALLPDAEVKDVFTGQERKVPSVTLRLDVGDGTLVIAQMKLDMLEMVVRAFRSRLEYLEEQRAAGKGEA